MHFVENLEAMYCSSLVQQKISENQRFIECSRKKKVPSLSRNLSDDHGIIGNVTGFYWM